MSTLQQILATAQARARELKLPYEGALTPREAWEVWQRAPGTHLVDVRSKAELDWVGRIPGAVEIEWASYPGMQRNPLFIDHLKRQVDREGLLLFICRSGPRSHFAASAATEAGFPDCYNILEGFEGEKDAQGRRNTVGGWRAAGLPWQQG
jgi:rhodanese-related sulfurtransferase